MLSLFTRRWKMRGRKSKQVNRALVEGSRQATNNQMHELLGQLHSCAYERTRAELVLEESFRKQRYLETEIAIVKKSLASFEDEGAHETMREM